jgi:predicted phage tail protein
MFKQYSTELSDKLDNPIKTAINEITTEVNRINEEAQSALATPKKQPATTSNELFKAFSAVVEWAKTGKPTVAFKVNEEKRRIIDDAESGKKSNL